VIILKKIKSIILIYLIIVITLTGCTSKNDNSELKEKVKQELNYIDDKIITMLNKLNNISLENYSIVSNQTTLNEKTSDESTSSSGEEKQTNQEESQGGTEAKQNNQITNTEMKEQSILGTNENNIDWELIQNEIEELNSSWSIILLDLYDLNVENTDILAFSNKINSCIVSIENKNKQETLNNLRDLYSYIPKYINTIEKDTPNQQIKQSKYYLLNSYVLVNEDNWGEVKNSLNNCENVFNNLSNNIEYAKDKEYKINKVYVLIKELENSLDSKDKKVFYIKYKNLLQSINSI
jgi:hypothetical protein